MSDDLLNLSIVVQDAETGEVYDIDDLSPAGLAVLQSKLEELLQQVRDELICTTLDECCHQ